MKLNNINEAPLYAACMKNDNVLTLYLLFSSGILENENPGRGYGILLCRVKDNEITAASVIPDLTRNFEKAFRFFDLLSAHSVMPEQLYELAEEVIEEL